MAGKFMLTVLSLLFRPHFSALPAVLLTYSLVTLAVKFSTKGPEKKKKLTQTTLSLLSRRSPASFKRPPLPPPLTRRLALSSPPPPTPNPNTHLLSSHQKRDSSGADRGKSAADGRDGRACAVRIPRQIHFCCPPPQR